MRMTLLLAAGALTLSVSALAISPATAQRRSPPPRERAPPPKLPPNLNATSGPATPSAADWRTPNPDDILVIDTNKGRIVVELVPEVAPQFAARIRELAREHFYDGQTFFRVVENFMDQTGDPQNTGTGGSTKPNVPGEFTFRRGSDTPWVQAADQTVAEVGFIRTLPVMSQSMMLAPLTVDQKVSAWPLYCPGVAGAARDSNPDSNNSQFFLMRGPYPSLEKRYTAWGRVVSGQSVVTAIKVGEPVADPQDRMERVRLLSDIPAAERPTVRVIDTKGAWFKGEVARLRALKGAEFSACDVNIPAAEVK